MTSLIKREVYIGTGNLTGFYTLHKVVYSYALPGKTGGFFYVDDYIKNLSTDAKKADQMAKDYAKRTGCVMTSGADFELDEHTNNELLNKRVIAFIKEQNVFSFGKYRGRTFSDIAKSDPQYIQWLKSEEVNIKVKQPAFKLSILAIQQLCEEGVLSIPEKTVEPVIQGVEKNPSDHIGAIGDKVELELKIVMRKNVSTAFGGSTLLIMIDENDNVVKTFTNASWLDEEAEDKDGTYFREAVIKGDRIKIKGTISAHQEYNGEKSTLIKRPKLVTNLKEAA